MTDPAVPATTSTPPPTGAPGTATIDTFGVRALYATTAGGREWFLPDGADLNRNSEFVPETTDITVVQAGSPTVYHTQGGGSDAEVRLNVHSPAGKAWWRNVEMTGYFRWTQVVGSGGPPHWELEARGERHSDASVTRGAVNDGAPPPAGTATWPWWSSFANGDALNAHALGTAYHGNVYALLSHGDLALFEKEITHTEGYGEQRGPVRSGVGLPPAQGAWFGVKYVLRNNAAATAVTMELWIDPGETGTWTKVTEVTDRNGAGNDWVADLSTLDGATAAPYGYAQNQLITWAGPFACFRSDNLAMDFKKLSIREIDPLP